MVFATGSSVVVITLPANDPHKLPDVRCGMEQTFYFLPYSGFGSQCVKPIEQVPCPNGPYTKGI